MNRMIIGIFCSTLVITASLNAMHDDDAIYSQSEPHTRQKEKIFLREGFRTRMSEVESGVPHEKIPTRLFVAGLLAGSVTGATVAGVCGCLAWYYLHNK